MSSIRLNFGTTHAFGSFALLIGEFLQYIGSMGRSFNSPLEPMKFSCRNYYFNRSVGSQLLRKRQDYVIAFMLERGTFRIFPKGEICNDKARNTDISNEEIDLFNNNRAFIISKRGVPMKGKCNGSEEKGGSKHRG